MAQLSAHLTLEDLQAVCPRTPAARLEPFVLPLNAALEEFSIYYTIARTAQFLAQVAHESGGFIYLREYASGEAYEGSERLGNSQPGDGPRFKGWGLIQVTGRTNTWRASQALFGDSRLVDLPQLIDPPALDVACRSAGWFWTKGAGLNLSRAARDHGLKEGVDLNDIADLGDFTGITLAINGGMNGAVSRLAYLQNAREALA